MNIKNIGILGCGWLGLPLASHFVSKGFEVNGSTTSISKVKEIKKHRINPFIISLPDQIDELFFKNLDVLIINIPPQSRSKGENHHYESLKGLIPYLKNIKDIIYISATSVYPDLDQCIDEEVAVDKESARAKALWQVEELLKQNLSNKPTIIRFGGLLGYDRVPGRYFSGKEVNTPDEQVNYIHRDDAIGLIEHIIANHQYGQVINGVAPKHPTKREVYEKNAEAFHFKPPIFKFKSNQLKNRQIDGSKVVSKLGYTFIYPDPLNFYYTQ